MGQKATKFRLLMGGGKEEDRCQWTNFNIISKVLFALYIKKSKANTIK